MAIGSPTIAWDLKHTGELWMYIGATLPNPSGNTGVMVWMMVWNILYYLCFPQFSQKIVQFQHRAISSRFADDSSFASVYIIATREEKANQPRLVIRFSVMSSQ